MKRFLQNFFALEIVPGKKVRLPYWCNKFKGKRIQGPFGGKGTPAEIKKAVWAKAKRAGVDLRKMTASQIRSFMKQRRIGIDCSGFAFQVLDFLQPGFYRGLKMAAGKSRNPIRRFSAAALTSAENSFPVKRAADIKPGDLIPLSFRGKKVDHVLIVVAATGKEIVYAHSSSRTMVTGPHLGRIKIRKKNQDLRQQQWLEKDKEGNLLSSYLFKGEARRVRTGLK